MVVTLETTLAATRSSAQRRLDGGPPPPEGGGFGERLKSPKDPALEAATFRWRLFTNSWETPAFTQGRGTGHKHLLKASPEGESFILPDIRR